MAWDEISASIFTESSILDVKQKPFIGDIGNDGLLSSAKDSTPLSLNNGFNTASLEEAARNIDQRLASEELKSTNSEVDALTGLSKYESWAGSQEAATLQAQGGGDLGNLKISGEYAPSQVIVKFTDRISAASVKTIQSQLNATVVDNKGLDGAELWKIQGTDVPAAIAALSKNPNIKYAEPNYLVSVNATPNDPSFSQLWGLNNTGQNGGKPDADIDAPEAWDIQTGGNVVVGVIDTGVDYNHPDLADNIWTNPGEVAGDGIDNDANGYIDDIRGYDFANNDADPMDDQGHGTHVSGTIAGRGNNGVGVTGVSWSSKIMPLKFLGANGGGTIANAIRAINYATQMGVKVTNNSWGGGGGFSQALYDAINAAKNAGSLFIASAGNGGSDQIGDNNDAAPTYPASYNLDNIISVAATDRNDNLAGFSNYGATSVDLGAPGVNIISTTPNNTYGNYNGTSMAAPHVSGVASLLLAQDPNMTYTQVKERLLGTGDVVSALAGKTVTARRLNAYNALTNTVPLAPGIYGTAWNDTNANGIRDTGEAGLQNWTVYQDTNNNGVLEQEIPGIVQTSTDIPKPIVDTATPITSNLAVSGLTETIQDVNVKLNISHTWDTDLDVFLIAPDGTRVELFTDVGGSGDNFTNTILDDQATTSIAFGTAPFTGTFKPEGLLSTLNGKNPNGTWKLEITDDQLGDAGTLNSWSLTLNSRSAEVSTQTAADGSYSFTNLNSGNYYTIREVVQSGWTQTAPSTGSYTVAYNAGDVVTNRDFGNAILPVITVTATDAAAAETVEGQTANPGLYTFTRTGSTTNALTVNYTMSGTATNGTDYNSLGTSISFAPGESSVTLPVTVIDDTLFEDNETAILTIAANADYTIGGADNATVTIADNDSPVITVVATDAAAAETQEGQAANPGLYTFTRTGSTTNALTVNYTVSGTATNDTDYNSLGASISFAAGETSVTLPVTVMDDTLLEGRETAIVTLVANAAYTLGTARKATVTIADNDLPVITVAATDAAAAETQEGQAANPGLYTFTRTGSTTNALTVNYTVGGTATNGTDYNSLGTSISFAPGETSVTLPVTVMDDTLLEGRETAIVALVANPAYTLGTAKTATVNIADNDLPVITVAATDAAAAETQEGQAANPGLYTFTRTGSTTNALTVNYTVGGTATNGTDYNSLGTSISFAPGETSVTMPVTVMDDTLLEGRETAIVTLVANAAYTLGTAKTATVNIADDDIAGNQTINGSLSTTDLANPTRVNTFMDDYQLNSSIFAKDNLFSVASRGQAVAQNQDAQEQQEWLKRFRKALSRGK